MHLIDEHAWIEITDQQKSHLNGLVPVYVLKMFFMFIRFAFVTTHPCESPESYSGSNMCLSSLLQECPICLIFVIFNKSSLVGNLPTHCYYLQNE